MSYTVQRAEVFAGLSLLTALYCVIRGTQAIRSGGWFALASGACAVGAASKPVSVVAPLLIAAYDRVFLARSWTELLQQRAALYGGLALSWLLLWLVLLQAPWEYVGTAGIGTGTGINGLSPLAYAATQPGVILHYLRLACWPHPLVFGYEWPVIRSLNDALPSLIALGGLLVLTGWALRRHPAFGFLGAWVALTLAPSSSIIPIADLAFEHRMYVPLAGLVTAAVMGVDTWLCRVVPDERARARIGAMLVLGAGAALGTITVARNAAYAHPERLWRDTVKWQPRYPRAHGNLGYTLQLEGRLDEAVAEYRTVLALRPGEAQAHHNLATALASQGRFEDAIAQFREALRLQPGYPAARYDLGVALARQGSTSEAIHEFEKLLAVVPRHAAAHAELGLVLAREHRVDEAVAHLAAALALEPQNVDMRLAIGRVLAEHGAFDAVKQRAEQLLAAEHDAAASKQGAPP